MRNHLLCDGRMIFSSLDGGDAAFFQIFRLSSFSFVFLMGELVVVCWSLITDRSRIKVFGKRNFTMSFFIF